MTEPRASKRQSAIWSFFVRHGPSALLVAVLVLTACLRWVRFTEFPPGLWYDEAYTLAQAQRLAQGGDFQIYYPEKHGEPAIIWLTALALRLGAGHLAPRWVTSVSGVVSVLLLFLAVRDIMRAEGRPAGWLAVGSAAVLGTNYEYLFHTRMSWQGALVTTTFIAAIWPFWRAMRDGRWQDFALAGLMAGVSQYTGVAARLLPLVLLLVLLGWLGGERRWRGGPRRRARWKGLLTTGGAALLAYAPLARAFLAHPEWFARRMQAGAPLSALLPNLGRTLAGWLWMGGAALHSLPGRPIYDPAMGFLLLVGGAVAAWRIRRPAYSVWLAWFVGVLPGGFLSQPTPMLYRVMPAVPATAALCAVGGRYVWQFATTRFPWPARKAAPLLLLLAVFAASTWATCRDYFVRWANWPDLHEVMDVWKWRAAEVILDSPAHETLLVTIPDGLEPAISYALHARAAPPARAFDGAHCLIYPTQASSRIHYLVVLGYEHRSLARLQALFPSGYQAIDPIFGGEAPYFVDFFVPAGTEVPVLGKLPAPITYQEAVLHGVHVPETTLSAGATLTVTLTWEILRPTANNNTVFVHLLDATPEAAEPPLMAQHDGPPCYATEPTWRWQPGEYILDQHGLTVPSDLLAGAYLLGVGLYDSATLERLHPAGEDLSVRWNEAIVGSVKVVTR
jgi:hypothetical protein